MFAEHRYRTSFRTTFFLSVMVGNEFFCLAKFIKSHKTRRKTGFHEWILPPSCKKSLVYLYYMTKKRKIQDIFEKIFFLLLY